MPILESAFRPDGIIWSIRNRSGQRRAHRPSRRTATGTDEGTFDRTAAARFYGGIEITLLPAAVSIGPEPDDPTVVDGVARAGAPATVRFTFW